MSKSLVSTGDLSSSANFPAVQQKGFAVSGKTSSFSRNNAINLPASTTNKLPRNTHKHHRKPEASLSHLLNFSYDRPANGGRQVVPRRSTRVTPSFGRGSGHHPLDKAHFVNANYRFVVHPSGDYRANLTESDIPIPWENVLQVLASVQSQCNACPICLEAIPVAPRMAKCGHVFCLPCALKYLDSEDIKTGKTTGKWRKCPICFDGVYASELRPVKWFAGDDSGLPVKGQDVTFQLIMRRTGSMFALPRDSPSVEDDKVPWHNQADALEYARLVKGDAQYMADESQREIMDMIIMKQQDAQEFGDADDSTAAAIENVEDRMTTFESMGLAPKIKASQNATRKAQRKPIKYETSSDIIPGKVDSQPDRIANEQIEESVIDAYYFYQPRTGSHYYLSPLDIRILKRAFGSFSNFPSALIAKLEHAVTSTVDDELRRRSKYLAHLPLGCEVTFLECDWSGVLSDDILATFKVDIDKRRKKRHDKAVTEETARRRAQALEERRQRAGLGELQWHDEDTSYFARNDESNTYEVFAEPIAASNASVSSGSLPTGSLERRSIWGTVLPSSQEAPAVPDEDDEWKEQLEQFYQESAVTASLETSSSTPGKKPKSKKKKLVLMSSGGGRGRG